MPITSTEIRIRLMNPAATSGSSMSQPDPNNSLGGFVSTTDWNGGSPHDLFDPISGAENASGHTDYRCLYVCNTNSTLTWFNVRVYFVSQVPGGANLAIGVDTNPARPLNSTTLQAVVIANETTAPTGVTFSAPTSYATGISLGDIPPNHGRAIWVRRTATNSPAINNDGGVLRFEGDTPP